MVWWYGMVHTITVRKIPTAQVQVRSHMVARNFRDREYREYREHREHSNELTFF